MLSRLARTGGTISRRNVHCGQLFPQFLRGQLEELPEAVHPGEARAVERAVQIGLSDEFVLALVDRQDLQLEELTVPEPIRLPDSNAWIVSWLILPRSATMQTRRIPKRRCRRSTTGIRVVTSAVLPGHGSQQIGRPWPSRTAPTTIW